MSARGAPFVESEMRATVILPSEELEALPVLA
jgi:hypothetical protein